MSHDSTHERRRNAPLELKVRNRGFLDQGLGGALLLVGLVIVAIVVGVRAGWQYGAMSAVLLALSAWRCFLPVVFEFGPLGIAERTPWRRTRRIAWNEMGRIDFLNGGLLITVNPNQPLGALRSVYIRYVGNREALERLVHTYVQTSIPPAAAEPIAAGVSTTDYSIDG